MSLELQVLKDNRWIDCTSKLTQLSHTVQSNQLESLEFSLLDEVVTAGERVRYKLNGITKFEGIIVSFRRTIDRSVGPSVDCRALSELILWERNVVYREYPTGTSAGAIIKDLAALEPGVDVSNVDEVGTPQLLAPWSIQNESALKVMQSVARGTDYWLRMKAGRRLYFKPKTNGTPVVTIDDSTVLSAEYSEDRWKLKNRVIYVGAEGRVLADVSEGAGDLPVVIHDPFLTSDSEARRRAVVRLARNRECGRQLKLRVYRELADFSEIDLFSTVRINLPSLGLDDVDMFVVEMSYSPRSIVAEIVVGGKLELLEDYLSEAIGGDIAARFGPQPTIIGEVTWIRSTLYYTQRALVATSYQYVAYLNKRPITVHRSSNVKVNDVTGEVELASGKTSGTFEVEFVPPGNRFARWGYVGWSSQRNDGDVTVEVRDSAGNVLASMNDPNILGWAVSKRIVLKRWPSQAYFMTKYPAFMNWGASSNAQVRDVRMGFLTGSCIRLEPTSYGSYGEIFYPLSKNLDLDLAWVRRMNVYLYSFDDNVTCKIRLHHNTTNYREAEIVIQEAGLWNNYSVNIATMSTVGQPTKINWISFLSNYPILIDSDYVFHQLGHEKITVRFNMTRPTITSQSPKISHIYITYLERS